MMEQLAFPATEDPRVSVVMVTYGQWGWVTRALHALLERTEPWYELIVVDNASPDGTGARLQEAVDGATVVRNERNVGFGGGNNVGVLHARGRFVLFLNSDCLVEPGWLPPMLERIERDPSIGAVVGKLVDLDGTMQEAGSLLDRDAYTLAYLRSGDPEDPAGTFPRDVVFGSAGFLLVRRSVFIAAGGFDPIFTPAYFEDVDLALTMAELGYRTVYEPRAVARHVREASTPSGISGTLMKAHRPIVEQRWRERLRALPSVDALDRHPHRLIAARDAATPDRVLVAGAPADWAEPLADRARHAPSVRWTVVSTDSMPWPDVAGAGVEVVSTTGLAELDEWLAYRRFHASVVVVGPHVPPEVDELLLRTQPQAERLGTLDGLDRLAELVVASSRSTALSTAG